MFADAAMMDAAHNAARDILNAARDILNAARDILNIARKEEIRLAWANAALETNILQIRRFYAMTERRLKHLKKGESERQSLT